MKGLDQEKKKVFMPVEGQCNNTYLNVLSLDELILEGV